MKLMTALEFASTGEAEISLFHKLSAGNGRKPFKLAPCPRDMPPQLGACVVPVTVKFTVEDVAAAGIGILHAHGVRSRARRISRPPSIALRN